MPLTTTLIQAERDALACLGLLAHAAARFDIPVSYPGESAPSHVLGLNIHALMVDNADGELLALERNTIHSDQSPLQHGEQRALRTAIAQVNAKRPRQPAQAIEGYYRTSMFMGRGPTPEDYLNAGGTLYTTLEPCPMCASSLLVCRVKRVVYLLPDHKYGGAWPLLKERFYSADESQYLPLAVAGTGGLADEIGALHARILRKADKLHAEGVRDTHSLDFCRDELMEAFEFMRGIKSNDLTSLMAGEKRNEKLLRDLQRALNMPQT